MQNDLRSRNPFPGLRPFRMDENHLFFGREDQVLDLLQRLHHYRFLAIVGASGCGKSSLIQAGLFPAIQGGRLNPEGLDWGIARFRPGNAPLANLASALAAMQMPDSTGQALRNREDIEARLRMGSTGLVDLVRQMEPSRTTRILVLADQFEELFRYRKDRSDDKTRNDAVAFVRLLLRAAKQTEIPIYVTIAMRSDFLGGCTEFRDLPEAINAGQYLVPRMGRVQRREAITGPVAVAGGRISELLVQRMLNEVGDDPDQLPILQHALMRIWDSWVQDHGPEEPVDMRHYEAIGGTAGALSRHAEEAYLSLTDPRGRRTAERLFQCLSEAGPDRRETRHPMRFGDLRSVTSSESEDLIRVIDAFRQDGRTFLMPLVSTVLDDETVIDITHESLIRQWTRLKEWAENEQKSGAEYRLISAAAERRALKQGELWRGLDLSIALQWHRRQLPTKPWAERYGGNFEQAIRFLKGSARRRMVRRSASCILVLVLLGLVEWYLYDQFRTAKQTASLLERISIASNNAFNDPIKSIRSSLEVVPLMRGAKLDFSTMLERTLHESIRNLPLIRTYRVHQGAALDVAFSPDGKRITTANTVGTTVWDDGTGQKIPTSEDGQGWVNSIAYSPDGKRLAAGSDGGTVTVRDAETWRVLLDIPFDAGVGIRAVVFHPDGRRIAAGSEDGTIRIVDLESGQTRFILHGHKKKAVNAVSFSPDGHRLATAGDDGTFTVWNADNGTDLYSIPTELAYCSSVVFFPDGRRLALACYEYEPKPFSMIIVFDTDNRKQANDIPVYKDLLYSLDISPDGNRIAAAGEFGRIRVWDSRTGLELSKIPAHKASIFRIRFSPDGNRIASASSDGTVRTWSLSKGDEIVDLPVPDVKVNDVKVNDVAFSPVAGLVATAASDGIVRMWDVETGQALPRTIRHEAAVNCVSFSGDGRLIATASEDKTAKVWDVATCSESHSFPHPDWVTSVQFSPNGRLLATACFDRTARVWDLPSGSELPPPLEHERAVNGIAFSADGKWIATASNDHSVRIWDADSHRARGDPLIGHEGSVNAVAFSPNHVHLATSSDDGTVRIWDYTTGRCDLVLSGHTDWVCGVAFSPDGKRVASASDDGTIKVWDSRSGEEIFSLTGHGGYVRGVAYSPDGSLIASASDDGSSRLYAANLDRLVRLARTRVDPALSEEEKKGFPPP